MSIAVRQAPVAEQSLSEKHTLLVLVGCARNWRDRLTLGGGMEC